MRYYDYDDPIRPVADLDRARRHASGESLLEVLLSPPCLIAMVTAYGEHKRRQADAARIEHASAATATAGPAGTTVEPPQVNARASSAASSPTASALSADSVITALELAQQASARDLERRREAQEAQRLAEDRLACQIRVNAALAEELAALAEELAAIRRLCEDACGFPVGSVVVAVRELLGPAREILDAARERRG